MPADVGLINQHDANNLNSPNDYVQSPAKASNHLSYSALYYCKGNWNIGSKYSQPSSPIGPAYR